LPVKANRGLGRWSQSQRQQKARSSVLIVVPCFLVYFTLKNTLLRPISYYSFFSFIFFVVFIFVSWSLIQLWHYSMFTCSREHFEEIIEKTTNACRSCQTNESQKFLRIFIFIFAFWDTERRSSADCNEMRESCLADFLQSKVLPNYLHVVFPPKFNRFHIQRMYVIRYNSLFLNPTNQRISMFLQ